jgi:hypothetical protein
MWRWLVHLLIKHKRYKFKQWIDLEDKKIAIAGALAENKEESPRLIFEFLTSALPLPNRVWKSIFWVDVVSAYSLVATALPVRRYLPIISIPYTGEPAEKPAWDYPGRTWYYYSNLIAHAYGWSLEYIANLDVFDGMALVEEILIKEQQDKEFVWNMSEASVSYDAKTKVTKHIDYPRPYWMTSVQPGSPVPIKKTKIPRAFMPIGEVHYEALPEEFHPKEIDPSRNVGDAPVTPSGISHR